MIASPEKEELANKRDCSFSWNAQCVLLQFICPLAGHVNVSEQSFLKAEGGVWTATRQLRSGSLYFPQIKLSV